MNASSPLDWQKILKIEEAYQDKDFLKKFNTPHLIFRPLFYAIFGFLAKTLFKAEVRGLENILPDPPYILAPNHQSAADFPFVAWALPKEARENLYALTTKHFYDNPFARAFIIAATNSLRVDTEKNFFPALQAAAKVLAQGKAIYMNPEGTWSETGELMEFKVGVGLLAYELNVPIIPVYIKGTYAILPPHAIFIKKIAKITVSFGQPIHPKDFKEANTEPYFIYKKITEHLRNAIIKLRDELA